MTNRLLLFFTQFSLDASISGPSVRLLSLSYRPHPPPPIGGGVGPAPWFILPIRLRPGNPGGLVRHNYN